jgi:hypothetical protein
MRNEKCEMENHSFAPTAAHAVCRWLNMSPSELWRFLPLGYLLTILIETPILCLGLSQRHPLRRKLLAGVWLTACTYPIVALVLPLLFSPDSRALYLVVAETFAPVAECVLFWLAFGKTEEVGEPAMRRDFLAIIAANLASFGFGEVMNAWGWFGLLGWAGFAALKPDEQKYQARAERHRQDKDDPEQHN